MRRNSLEILRVPLLSLLFAFCTPSFAVAGWLLVATTTFASSPSSIHPSSIVLAAAHNKIKYETQGWALSVDLTTQRLLVTNHLRQLYWEGPIDEYLAVAAARALEVRTQRDKLLQRLPPEQQMIMEKRGGPFDSPTSALEITVSQTSEEAVIAGYEARKYVILRNGEPYEETWIAKAINVAAEIDKQKFKNFLEKLRESRTTPPGVVLAELIPLAGKGYPVKTVNVLSQAAKEVRQAEQKNLPDETFAAPQDYVQRPLTDVMATRESPAKSSP